MRDFGSLNPSQQAVIKLIQQLKSDGEPASNVMDALLFMGGVLLANAGLPRSNVQAITSVVGDLSLSPEHPMVKEFLYLLANHQPS